MGCREVADQQELVRFLDDHDCERLAFDYYLDDATRFV